MGAFFSKIRLTRYPKFSVLMTDYDILPKKVRAKGPGSEASSRVILG